MHAQGVRVRGVAPPALTTTRSGRRPENAPQTVLAKQATRQQRAACQKRGGIRCPRSQQLEEREPHRAPPQGAASAQRAVLQRPAGGGLPWPSALAAVPAAGSRLTSQGLPCFQVALVCFAAAAPSSGATRGGGALGVRASSQGLLPLLSLGEGDWRFAPGGREGKGAFERVAAIAAAEGSRAGVQARGQRRTGL